MRPSSPRDCDYLILVRTSTVSLGGIMELTQTKTYGLVNLDLYQNGRLLYSSWGSGWSDRAKTLAAWKVIVKWLQQYGGDSWQ